MVGENTYLFIGKCRCSAAGWTALSNGTIKGISARSSVSDPSRVYEIRFVRGPGNTNTTIATLEFNNTTYASRRDLNAAFTKDWELGVVVVLTTGNGNSSFDNLVVAVEIDMPRA